jgi:CheY-like chemotaxis protein
LVSNPGAGSTFTLYLPRNFIPPRIGRRAVIPRLEGPRHQPSDQADNTLTIEQIELVESLTLPDDALDDRHAIETDDRVLLIVDNDVDFASFVLERAQQAGFKGLIAPSGGAGLSLASEFHPQAILLDISLPDFNGFRLLKRLKSDPGLRHIPVYIVSTIDSPERGIQQGARGVLPKPIRTTDVLDGFLRSISEYTDRRERHVLWLDPKGDARKSTPSWMQLPDVRLTWVETGQSLLGELDAGVVDAVVLTPQPQDMSLASLAEAITANIESGQMPILLFSGHDGDPERWRRLAREFNLRSVENPAHLTAEIAAAVCRPLASLPEDSRRRIEELQATPQSLAGKKVLIVDDDIRNIFALTSVLERHDVVTISAETGRDAINLLHASDDVEIVLMDIMMPELDGIDTMKAIRQVPRFRDLPIVAVTAKAMKGDREKCIGAGAWDYLSKPVNPDQMLATLRAWLSD